MQPEAVDPQPQTRHLHLSLSLEAFATTSSFIHEETISTFETLKEFCSARGEDNTPPFSALHAALRKEDPSSSEVDLLARAIDAMASCALKARQELVAHRLQGPQASCSDPRREGALHQAVHLGFYFLCHQALKTEAGSEQVRPVSIKTCIASFYC